MKPNHFCHSPNILLYVTLESSIKDGMCLKSDIEYLISCSMRIASYHRGEWQLRKRCESRHRLWKLWELDLPIGETELQNSSERGGYENWDFFFYID